MYQNLGRKIFKYLRFTDDLTQFLYKSNNPVEIVHLRKKIAMRFQDEQSLKDLINQVVDQKQLKPKILEARIIASWAQIVGEPIARYTEKIYVSKGKLYITITSPALRNELGFQRKALADLVNKELNCDFIEDVIIY